MQFAIHSFRGEHEPDCENCQQEEGQTKVYPPQLLRRGRFVIHHICHYTVEASTLQENSSFTKIAVQTPFLYLTRAINYALLVVVQVSHPNEEEVVSMMCTSFEHSAAASLLSQK